MKFSIKKSQLLNILQLSSKAVPTRSTIPVISCALFTCTNTLLNIRTTDLEVGISINSEVENAENGKVAVPLNKLLEITSALSDENINFSVSDIGKISIENGPGKYTIMGISSEEFPTEQVVEKGATFTISGKELISIINNTTYAASRDDLKPVLQGVLFQIDEKGFVTVATDGHRLVKIEKNNIHTLDFNGSVVVPAKFLSLLNSQLEEENEAEMIIGENHIQIKLINGTITSRIIKDPYPDYEGVIPKDNTKTLIIDKDAFYAAIKRVSIFSNKASRQVSLNISENNIIISTEDPENITSGKETLDCSYDGEPMIIGYNATYLKEVIQHQNCSEIKIMLKSPLNAGLFLPMEQKENENKTTLLMPIRLTN